jgi:hypothetical protein
VLLTLFTSLVALTEFGYLLFAEQMLARAARAAALEATLPRATLAGVEAAAARRLGSVAQEANGWRLELAQNGVPVRKLASPCDDDRIKVSLELSARAALPGWLRSLSFWRSDFSLEASAERRMPGRQVIANR